jgi:hypothetical protein
MGQIAKKDRITNPTKNKPKLNVKLKRALSESQVLHQI